MLEGENIALRPLKDSDLDFLAEIENNHKYWQFGSEQKKYSREELANYIKNARVDISVAKQYRFVIDLENTPIGLIDLFDYTRDTAGIGVIIIKDYRNKGFAKEALNLIIDYSFFILDIKQLYASIKKDNVVSIKLFTSCSFQLDREVKGLQYFIKLAKNNIRIL